jgi:hypothetical protein
MIQKLLLLVCLTFALVATVSADMPAPPCDPCLISSTSAR